MILSCEQVCKPGSVLNGHLSWYVVTDVIMRSCLKQDEQPLAFQYRPCFKRGLQSPLCYQRDGKLLPYLSTLTVKNTAVYFCCTFLRVASTGR